MNRLDLSLHNRHSLGKVYDFILQQGRGEKMTTTPDLEASNLATTSILESEPDKQSTGSLLPDRSVLK